MTDPVERPRSLAPGIYPPEHIEFGEFRLRRPVLEDAEALHLAIRASFADLHLWMPWCVEPVNIEEQRGFIERSTGNWESRTAFAWFIVDTQGALIGTVSLMDRVGPGGLEIGYWLRTDATGGGVMTRVVSRITDIALGLPGIERVEIICDAANLRSRAVPRRAGYRLAREGHTEPTAPGECGLDQHWVMP
jgi:RimJ/RimL family protein N-acetyltransferase